LSWASPTLYFVTLANLENAQQDMEYLDKVKARYFKFHGVCLNDGRVEENNGTEVRVLLTNFLQGRYTDPAPWEKA